MPPKQVLQFLIMNYQCASRVPLHPLELLNHLVQGQVSSNALHHWKPWCYLSLNFWKQCPMGTWTLVEPISILKDRNAESYLCMLWEVLNIVLWYFSLYHFWIRFHNFSWKPKKKRKNHVKWIIFFPYSQASHIIELFRIFKLLKSDIWNKTGKNMYLWVKLYSKGTNKSFCHWKG